MCPGDCRAGVVSRGAGAGLRVVRRDRVLGWLIAGVLCLLGSPAWSAPRPAPDDGVGGVDAELMIRFDDLASLLDTPQGRALARLADGLGFFGHTRGAWADLSGALKLGPGEAFRRLLGGRAVLIADGVGEETARWAWVMEVSREDAARLPRRLKAAPRGGMDGRAVYAVEDGRFRVIVTPRPVASVAIAPAGSEGMLRAAASLGAGWAEAGEGRRRGGAVVLYRPGLGAWLFGRLRPEPAGWTMSFDATPELLGTAGWSSPAISRRWFDTISDDTALSFIGPVGEAAGDSGGAGSWFDLGPGGMVWRLVPLDPPDVAVFSSGRVRAGSVSIGSLGRGRLDCTVGFLADDREGVLREGDAYACGLLESFTGSKGYRESTPLCTGAYPVAARLQTVELAEGNPRRSLYGPRLSFVWGVRPNEGGGVWWSLRVLSDNVPDATAALLRFRSPIDPGDSGRASMMGLIRPARLLGMLAEDDAPGIGPGVSGGGPISEMRLVDEIRWWVGPGESGVSRGEVRIRMHPSP